MADQTLESLTAATPATGGLIYGTQGGADRKFTLTATGAAVVEAAYSDDAVNALLPNKSGRANWVLGVSADGLSYVLKSKAPLPRSYIAGFRIDYYPYTYAEVRAGVCRDDTDTYDMQIYTSILKGLSTTWAEGDSKGGMDGSTWQQNTNYSVWAIYKPATSHTDVIFSASATSPTMPTGYVAKRRIGWVRTKTSSAMLVPWVQSGEIMVLNSGSASAEYNAGIVTTMDTAITVNAPPFVIAQLKVYGSATSAWSLSLDATDGLSNLAITAARSTLTGAANAADAGHADILTNASSQINARALGATVTTQISCRGWVDKRGRDE